MPDETYYCIQRLDSDGDWKDCGRFRGIGKYTRCKEHLVHLHTTSPAYTFRVVERSDRECTHVEFPALDKPSS